MVKSLTFLSSPVTELHLYLCNTEGIDIDTIQSVTNNFTMLKWIFTYLPIVALTCEALENFPGICGWICVWNSQLEWGVIQIIVCVWYRDEVIIKTSG
jgi:hypothetical protein